MQIYMQMGLLSRCTSDNRFTLDLLLFNVTIDCNSLTQVYCIVAIPVRKPLIKGVFLLNGAKDLFK